MFQTLNVREDWKSTEGLQVTKLQLRFNTKEVFCSLGTSLWHFLLSRQSNLFQFSSHFVFHCIIPHFYALFCLVADLAIKIPVSKFHSIQFPEFILRQKRDKKEFVGRSSPCILIRQCLLHLSSLCSQHFHFLGLPELHWTPHN